MKKIFRILGISALAVVLGLLAFHAHKESLHTSKYLTVQSSHWAVHINMIRHEITQIVMAPSMDFDYPETITVEFQGPDRRTICTQELTLQRTQETLNGYYADFPTTESAYKAGDAMTLVVTWGGASEKMKLKTETAD